MRRYLYATSCYALFIVALHFLSGRFSPLSSWGFYHLNEFPKSVRILLCLVGAVVCLPPINSLLSAALSKMADRAAKLKAGFPPHVAYILISALFAVLFWWLRSGNIFLGDGVTLAQIVRSDEALKHYVGGWAGHVTSHQILDFWIGRNLHRILSGVLKFEPYDTIALLSCVAGALFCFAALEIGHLLWDDWPHRLGFASVVFTTGAMQLFFGYVETYGLSAAALALFCLTTLLYARGRCGIWLPAALLALSASLHLLTFGAGLALLFAWVHRSRERGKYCMVEFALMACVPLVVVAIYFVILHSLGFSVNEIFFSGARGEYEGVFFLALSRRGLPLERYSLFSVAHLIDIFNEIVLVSPFGLFLCVVSLPRFLKADRVARPEALILLLTCVVYLGVTLTAAPLLGARKDWDVFAPPWIFITMLGAYMLMRAIPDGAAVRRILIIVVAVSLVHSVPWILSNARIDLEKYLEYRGEGKSFEQEGLIEQASENYEKALAINFTPELAYKVAGLQIRSGRLFEAVDLLKKAIREENRSELAIFLEQEDAHYLLGSTFLGLGKTDEAIAEFKKAIDLWEFRHNKSFRHLPDAYYHLGVAYMKAGNYAAAEKAFLSALETGGDIPLAHLALGELYARYLNKPDAAREHLRKYLETNPGDEQATELLEGLKSDA